MKRCLLLLPLLLLASCATCWRGGEPLRTNELKSLHAVAADLRTADNIVVYHGLAHPVREYRPTPVYQNYGYPRGYGRSSCR